jgi:hypothetical protein
MLDIFVKKPVRATVGSLGCQKLRVATIRKVNKYAVCNTVVPAHAIPAVMFPKPRAKSQRLTARGQNRIFVRGEQGRL